MELRLEQTPETIEELQQVIEHLMQLEGRISSLESHIDSVHEQLRRFDELNPIPDSLNIRIKNDEEN